VAPAPERPPRSRHVWELGPITASESNEPAPQGADNAATPDARPSLSGYRLYFLGAGDHIRHVVVLECPDDEAAIALAESHHDGRTMELWLRDRLVKRFERVRR